MPDHMGKKRDRDPLRPIPPSKHPFQFWMMFACAVIGALTLLGATSKSQFTESIPEWTSMSWGFILFVSGTIGLVSPWWKDRVMGLLLERTGLQALGLGCLVYCIWLGYLIGVQATVPIFMTASAGIAALWRVRHVSKELQRLTDFIDRCY